MKTIQEIKDEVARKYTGKSWDEFWVCSKANIHVSINEMIDESMQLYASQFQQNKEIELPKKGMQEITIYKFQLETIIEALRITSNIHNSKEGKTCHDRQVRQAYEYSKNALANEKDKEVPYM